MIFGDMDKKALAKLREESVRAETAMRDVKCAAREILDNDPSYDAMDVSQIYLEKNNATFWIDIEILTLKLFNDVCGEDYDETLAWSVIQGAIARSTQTAFEAVEASLGVKGIERMLEDRGYYRSDDEKLDKLPDPMTFDEFKKALKKSD